MQPNRLELSKGLLGIAVEKVGTTTTIALVGELDLSNADSLEEVLADGEETTVLDLSDLEFIDSTGMVTLVRARDRFERDGGALRIIPSRSEAVRRVFAVSGLDHRLPFLGGG